MEEGLREVFPKEVLFRLIDENLSELTICLSPFR
jgi:hypothetical protein